MKIATKLDKPIPNTKPPTSPSIIHPLSVPAIPTNTQKRIGGNSNTVIPSATRKPYPMGCFALNSSSDEAQKYALLSLMESN